MDSSNELAETIKRVQREIDELLAEVHAGKLDKTKLETGLGEVKSGLRVLDIHVHRLDPK